MNIAPSKSSADPVIEAMRFLRRPFASIALFSSVVNLLVLTSPLFMLQVYDRVVPSRSVPTLVALVILMIALFAFMGALDSIRSRVLMRLGQRLDETLSTAALGAVLLQPLRSGNTGAGAQPLRDLEQVRRFVCGPGAIVVFDLPWAPLYLLLVFLLHPLLGLVAACGAAVLVALAALNERGVRKPTLAASQLATARVAAVEAGRRNAEILAALGMRNTFMQRYANLNERFLTAQRTASDVGNTYTTMTKTFRFILQSLVLGIGAGLAIEQKVTPGIMIAASIISSRALAPIEQAVAQWRDFVATRQSFARLRQILLSMPKDAERTALPAPSCSLSVRELAVMPPGATKPVLAGISFDLKAGDGLGIIGPSASGKSTLARALVGVWPAARGSIRIDGADLDQWPAGLFRDHVGYLPQDVELFEGSIAENISRFLPGAASEAIVAAAKQAGAHEMILAVAGGYNAQIGESGCVLSGGQRQRIGLARALYGNPFIIVLDEPNAHTDAQGDVAVQEAIRACRARGAIVIVVAHRPSAIGAVDLVMVLDRGLAREFGPKEDILRKAVATSPV